MDLFMPKNLKIKSKKPDFQITQKKKVTKKSVNSFSKAFLSKFKSVTDLISERPFIRFTEGKSIYDLSIGKDYKYKTSFSLDDIAKIAKNNNYNLKNATMIHPHVYDKNIALFPSVVDIKSALLVYFKLGIHKHAISCMDKNNINEIGRIQYILNKESHQKLQELVEINKLNPKPYSVTELIDQILKKYHGDPEIKIFNKYTLDYYMGSVVRQLFSIRYVPLNGYKFDAERYIFYK
jgi:hypothetical protein